MVMFDYFESVLEGVEFLIAVGSIVGLLGLIIGFIFLAWGSNRMRYKMTGVIIVSFILLGVCGPVTGVKYFRLFR
jgi:ABC-type xylose transport system permease subunit